ncbi:MAG: polysaccharide biosynthesis tyrosine autokinase [Bacteroidia bacterium]|nr:polysaccharide biosynthesis tyrosine autokinase [Bacteroidia bacterium]
MADFISQPNQESRDTQAFKKFYRRIKTNKYWILFSLIFFIFLAWLFLRYSIPVFQAKTTLLIKDSGGFQDPSEILFGEITFQTKEKVFNESTIITSQPLIFLSLRQLGFWVSFYSKGLFNNIELYEDNPFAIVVDTAKVFACDSSLPYGVDFKVTLIDSKTYQLTAESEGTIFYGPFSINQKVQFNQIVKVGNFEFALRLVKPEKIVKDIVITNYSFRIHNLKRLAADYKRRLVVNPEPVGSTIIDVSIQQNVPRKAVYFLQTLVRNYASQNLDLKNEVSIKTIEFIDKELKQTSDTLGSVEAQLEQFKSSYQIADLSIEAKMLLEELSKLEEERAKYIIAQKYYEYLKNNINNEDFNNGIFPFSLGENQDPILNKLVMDLISLQLEKKVYLDQGMIQSPQVKLLEDRIKTLRNKILENVNNLLTANSLAMNDLNNRIKQVEQSVKQLPKSERELVNIQRNYKLSENLYVFLMEKRTEAAISRSSNTPDVQIVEPAMLDPDDPVFPKPVLVYAAAIFLGLFIPLGVILAKHFSQNTILDKVEISQKTDVPFLGSIPHNYDSNKRHKLITFEKPRSGVSEAFRILRSNINYYKRTGQDQQGSVILLTSSIANEGKTFTATNLAVALSMAGKKTIILGLDLRKPKIHEYLNAMPVTSPDSKERLGQYTGVRGLPGITDYLKGNKEIQDVIYQTQADYLYVIPSGSDTNNPSELLLDNKMPELIEYLKANFSFVVLDTPPIGLVTDALILSKLSDINIFVTRQNITKVDFIDYVDELHQSKKISNLCILLNDVSKDHGYGYGYYGYGYGYGYYEEDEPWFQKIRRKIKYFFRKKI